MALNQEKNMSFEKIIMILHKDREVHFKCKVFFKKTKMKRCISSVKNFYQSVIKAKFLKNKFPLFEIKKQAKK